MIEGEQGSALLKACRRGDEGEMEAALLALKGVGSKREEQALSEAFIVSCGASRPRAAALALAAMDASKDVSKELREAAGAGFLELIETLVLRSKEPGALSAALWSAAINDQWECVIKLAPICPASGESKWALVRAASQGREEAARALLPLSDPSECAEALKSAAKAAEPVMLKLLLTRCDSPILIGAALRDALFTRQGDDKDAERCVNVLLDALDPKSARERMRAALAKPDSIARPEMARRAMDRLDAMDQREELSAVVLRARSDDRGAARGPRL